MTSEKMQERILLDLAKLTVDRVRKQVVLVTQVLEDETDTAAIMLAVASDMIAGAAYHIDMSEEDITEEQAICRVFDAILGTLNARDKAAVRKLIIREKSK
jgi:hypothetical protein